MKKFFFFLYCGPPIRNLLSNLNLYRNISKTSLNFAASLKATSNLIKIFKKKHEKKVPYYPLLLIFMHSVIISSFNLREYFKLIIDQNTFFLILGKKIQKTFSNL